MSEPPQPNLRVVLIEPRNPLNIGAAARAMSNFGFFDLRLVKPYDVAFREAVSGVGAGHIMDGARVYETLTEALEGVSLVVGATGIGHRQFHQSTNPTPDRRATRTSWQSRTSTRGTDRATPEARRLNERDVRNARSADSETVQTTAWTCGLEPCALTDQGNRRPAARAKPRTRGVRVDREVRLHVTRA